MSGGARENNKEGEGWDELIYIRTRQEFFIGDRYRLVSILRYHHRYQLSRTQPGYKLEHGRGIMRRIGL